MTTSRRDFIKTAGIAAGALSLPALPAWINSVVAAEEAAAAAVDKNALAEIALNTARKLGVTYADIRINRYRSESINTRERQVLNVSRGQNFGFGVRVLYKGTWGFASSRSVTPDAVQRITQQAVEITRANSAYQRKRISMVPVEKVVTTWKNAFEKDPFEVSIDDKIQFLLALGLGLPAAWFVSPDTFFFLMQGLVLVLAVIFVYGMANLGVFLYYWRERRGEFNPIFHFVFPFVTTGVLAYALVRSFQPFPPEPYKWAPLIVGLWMVVGIAVLVVLKRRGKEDWLAKAGEIVAERQETQEEAAHRPLV